MEAAEDEPMDGAAEAQTEAEADLGAQPAPDVETPASAAPEAEAVGLTQARTDEDAEPQQTDAERTAAEEPSEEAVEAAPEPVTEAEAEPPEWRRSDGDGETVGEQAWDAGHYSTAIEEPGWISADDVAVPAPPSDERPAPIPPPTEWEPRAVELSGSRELDEALAALDALAHPGMEQAGPTERRAEQGERPDPQRPAGDEPGSTADAPWTRATPPPQLVMRSPTSRAYRRLKRIFPN